MFQTFQNVLSKHQPSEIYPPQVTNDLQTVIENWFLTRKICSENENDFIRFFKNVLNRDYARYNELLRIEPGFSRYDWLVQNYNEAQTYNAKNGKVTGTETNDESGNSTKTNNLTQRTATAQNGNVTTLLHGKKTETETNTDADYGHTITTDQSNETTHGHVVTTDQNAETTHGHKIDKESSDTITYGRTSTRTGSESDSRDSSEWGNESETNDNIQLSKVSPQSISYQQMAINPSFSPATDVVNPSANNNQYASLNWNSPSSQGESSNIKNAGSRSGSSDSTTRTYNSVTDTNGGEDARAYTESTENSGKDTTDTDITVTNSGTDKTEVDSVVTHGGRDSNSLTSTSEDSGTDTTTQHIDQSTTNTGTQSDEHERNSVKDMVQESESSDLLQHVSTGRNVDIATLLSNAVAFISSTSAWDWLRSRLNTCFLGIYDI